MSFNSVASYSGTVGSIVLSNYLLTSHLEDIVHGDVKCENVLVFEKPDDDTRDRDSEYSTDLVTGHC